MSEKPHRLFSCLDLYLIVRHISVGQVYTTHAPVAMRNNSWRGNRNLFCFFAPPRACGDGVTSNGTWYQKSALAISPLHSAHFSIISHKASTVTPLYRFATWKVCNCALSTVCIDCPSEKHSFLSRRQSTIRRPVKYLSLKTCAQSSVMVVASFLTSGPPRPCNFQSSASTVFFPV